MSLQLAGRPLNEASPSTFEENEYLSYRAVCSMAVVSSILGGLSIVALFDLVLGLIPLLGIVTGVVAWRRIQAQPRELTGQRWALLGIVLSALFMVGGWGHIGYVYATEVPDGYQRISYSQLHVPAENIRRRQIPESAQALDGQRVFIKGYVFPGSQQSGIKQFVLVRDNGDCCFGGPAPPLGDMVLVNLGTGLQLNYSTRLHRIGGTFRVAPALSSDVGEGVLYQIDADYIR